MANNRFSTEIREVSNSKYLKVFFLDDSEAKKTQEILLALKKVVKTVNITVSESKLHPGDTLTIYPKPMVDIDILDKEVKKSLDSYFSGVTDVKTMVMVR